MTRQEFLGQIEAMMEVPAGTLSGTELLADTEKWDSLMVLVFMSLVDEKFEVALPAKMIAACRTFNDLMDLLPGHIH